MKITHFVLALTLLVAANAWAELEILQKGIQMNPADEPPTRQIGAVWRGLEDGRPYTASFVSETDSSVTWTDSSGCTWTEPKGFYRAPSTEWSNCNGNSGSARVKFRGGSVYPLRVGNEWAFEQNGGNWRTSRDCEVEDAVRVKTASGEHETFKIVCADKWNTRTYYYSPQLQTNVYIERWHHKSGKRFKYEFISYE